MVNYLGIGFSGNGHTADYVQILANGPGAERFAGLIQNTDVFGRYIELAGIDFETPSMSLLVGAAPGANGVEHAAHYAVPFSDSIA